MNFIEAAVEILSGRADQPIHIQELVDLVVAGKLLSKPAKNPLGSMKGRLTTELKKGDDSRVVKVGDDLWQLREQQLVAEAPAPVATADVEVEPVPEVEAEEAPAPLPRGEVAIADLYSAELAPVELGAAFPEFRDAQTADEDRLMLPEIVAPRRERFHGRQRDHRRDGRRGKPRERNGRDESRRRDAKPAEASPEREVRVETPAAASPADEVRAEAPVAVSATVASAAPTEQRPPRREEPELGAEAVGPRIAGNAIADGAVQALATLKSGQSVPVRQIAQMMRKRKLLNGNPEQLAPLLKVAMLNDERSHLDNGLLPRIVHRGRDLFALALSTDDEAMLAASAGVASAVNRAAVALHESLSQRLAALPLPALQRLVHLFLLRTGWSDIEWIKQVGKASYAQARCPAPSGRVLVGVRADGDEVPRGGVGELRAGIEAKQLDYGLLIATRGLSAAAKAELGKEGPYVGLLVGGSLTGALCDAGVGVVKTAVPISYVDDAIFAELARK